MLAHQCLERRLAAKGCLQQMDQFHPKVKYINALCRNQAQIERQVAAIGWQK
jgi:hypothetical protein